MKSFFLAALGAMSTLPIVGADDLWWQPGDLLPKSLPSFDRPSVEQETTVKSKERDATTSDDPTAADFVRDAMKIRTREIAEVEPMIQVPTASRITTTRYPWKRNIVTTVFWIGERTNKQSVWDTKWTDNYGGLDNPDPSSRRSYIPVAFVPHENPFYFALPYNDVTHGTFKPEARLVIPWFKRYYMGEGNSVCQHRWIAIHKGNRTCYAQWEDCGPFRTDHWQYVFGTDRPKPNANRGSGLNVSPAIRDYLGLQPTDVTDWQFVDPENVAPGPWRSYGSHNNFVLARRGAELRQAGEVTPTP